MFPCLWDVVVIIKFIQYGILNDACSLGIRMAHFKIMRLWLSMVSLEGDKKSVANAEAK